MVLIDGKTAAQAVKDQVKKEVAKINTHTAPLPCLAVVLVGNNPASAVYVNNKKKACEYTGILSVSYELPEDITQEELLALIQALNKDTAVHGILVQLPLPDHINSNQVIEAIAPEKDVDGFHPINTGKLFSGIDALTPCTPAGIMELLRVYEIGVSGKNAVVLGRSNIVGKPVSMLLLKENATVTIVHSKTQNLAECCRNADILVAAVGIPGFVKADMVQPGAAVIDVGINRLANGKLCGDVDFENVKTVAGAITPVPGGVGPMTIAMLMKNCLQAYHRMKVAANG